ELIPEPRERDWRTLRAATERAWFPGGQARDLRRAATVEVGPEPTFPAFAHRPPGEAAPRQASCRVTLYQSNRVVIEASLDEAGLLVLPDLYCSGWRAEVDGRPVP